MPISENVPPETTPLKPSGLPWREPLVCIAAAVAIWVVIQAVHPIFRVSKEFDVPSIGMPTEKFLAHRAQQDRVDRKHAALYLSGLGALMAVGIGLCDKRGRRLRMAGVVATTAANKPPASPAKLDFSSPAIDRCCSPMPKPTHSPSGAATASRASTRCCRSAWPMLVRT